MCTNPYTNISSELKTCFGSNSIFKILLPIDMVFLFGGLAIMVLNGISRNIFGDLIYSISCCAFILGLLLAYANMHKQFLYVGLLGYGAMNAIEFIITLLKPTNLRQQGHIWSYLICTLIFGYLGYLVFKKTAIHQ